MWGVPIVVNESEAFAAFSRVFPDGMIGEFEPAPGAVPPDEID